MHDRDATRELTPDFTRHALGIHADQALNDHASGAEGTENIDGMDSLTLEFSDNPLASFLRHLDRLIEIDPAEAYRQTQQILSEKVFGNTPDSRLLSKFDEIIEKMAETQPDNHFGLSTASAFMQAAYHTKPYRLDDGQSEDISGLRRDKSPFDDDLKKNAFKPETPGLFG